MLLGTMRVAGYGVSMDLVLGYMWLVLAAANATGEQAADYSKTRDGFSKELTQQEILRAQQLASEWKPLPK